MNRVDHTSERHGSTADIISQEWVGFTVGPLEFLCVACKNLDNKVAVCWGRAHLSSASLKYFLCTSNWKMVLSQSVEALSLPPCFFRKASKPFSAGYFSLPMNTTEHQEVNSETGVKRRRWNLRRRSWSVFQRPYGGDDNDNITVILYWYQIETRILVLLC